MTFTEQISSNNTAWFQRWFDSTHYHKLYQHRNEKEASDFINLLVNFLQTDPGSSFLDLGCGAGRHAKHLATKGFRVTGIDLSSASIREAKKAENEFLKFFRRDMRDPFGSKCFDYVFNFFTSFGYFNSQEQNELVIRNISNSLKDYGTLVLDFMNTRYVEERLAAYEEKQVDGVAYRISRWIEQKFICKEITIDGLTSDEKIENTERVARLTLDDFKRMFRTNGLLLEAVFGNYQLMPFDLEASPRLIMVARKII